MRSGILAAGNWIRDHVKTVDAWPEQDGLATILEHSVGNGGGPYNLLKDLARMGAPFPLAGAGLLGDDDDGRAVLAECRALGIDAAQLRTAPGRTTSYTDVITVRGTGRRTFFHHRGANALFGAEHIDLERSRARIFYLGYLLLLDALDAPGADAAPRALDVLRRARACGMETSIDCVSAAGDRFRAVVAPVLPEVDVLFANDYEAEQLAGIALGRGAAIDRAAVERAARALAGLGVRRWAVVHFPEGACACSSAGQVVWQAAVRVPPREVRGSAGAGDALAAGVLLGEHEGWPMARALELGVCAAATSLLHPNCSDSVGPSAQCLAFGREHGFAALP
ncbi:MAG: carbohydrate kinase family protein [Opitutaceae bacterium]|jgi:sugar/nucleoside kinase (ribokinase family)